MAGIFNAAIFNNTIFNTGDAASPVVVAETQQPAGRGSSSPAARRRRYIMPDGQMVFATTQEAVSLLQLYAVPKEAPRKAAPAIELQKREIRFVPATDTLPDTYKAVLSERFTYRAPAEAYRQAEIIANRMRADEEAILALIL